MKDVAPEILVLPRKLVQGLDGFVPWGDAEQIVAEAENRIGWMPRTEAEQSSQWIQPIPCAIFRDSNQRYCVFRQAPQRRRDLSRRISLIVGGHIDRGSHDGSICQVFEDTVRREALEEVGLTLSLGLKPAGMVVDSSSIVASRHVGVVYDVPIDSQIKSLSSEEFFSIRSKYHGQFVGLEELSGLRFQLDPWSSILLSQYLTDRLSMDLGRQSTLALLADE